MMSVSEKLLLRLSRPREVVSTQKFSQPDWTVESTLNTFLRVYPDFLTLIKDKRIIHFGCGQGLQSVAMAKFGAKEVVGIIHRKEDLEFANRQSKKHNVEGKTIFSNTIEKIKTRQFDLIISQNSMEHFNDPKAILLIMKSLLADNGKIFVTFGPPWFAPYGSHMQYFTRLPWIHILFPERTVMRVRALYRDDGARRYEDVELGLNKMSLKKFENLISVCRLKITHKKYEGVKKLNFLTGVPGVRELMTNHVTCLLEKNDPVTNYLVQYKRAVTSNN